jgi:serine/threonine protein kinase
MTEYSNISDLKYISSGGFGKVYELKNTSFVVKKMDTKYEENLREICFLSTYKHVPFITQIVKTEIDTTNKNIDMYMKNAGLSLRELSDKISLEERIKMVPYLMIQFARILIWMRQEKILHCDIKPRNICIDENKNVTIIDWGFVQKTIPTKKYTIGTELFYDPYTLEDKIDYSSEMFAFGLSICHFVTKSLDYDKWDEFCSNCDIDELENNRECYEINKEALKIINIESIKPLMCSVFQNSTYYEILLSMIYINPIHRIDMFDLYNNFSDELKLQYSLVECYTHLQEDISISIPKNQIITSPEFLKNGEEFNKNENADMTKLQNDKYSKNIIYIIDWLIHLKFKFKIKYSLFNTFQILFKLLNIVLTVNYSKSGYWSLNEQSDKLALLSSACFYISNIMNNENITLSTFSKMSGLKKEKIIESVFNVLSVLNYEVYPETENIEYNKKDENIWKFVFKNIQSVSKINFENMYYEIKNTQKEELLKEISKIF